jgi:hypothetical protein
MDLTVAVLIGAELCQPQYPTAGELLQRGGTAGRR